MGICGVMQELRGVSVEEEARWRGEGYSSE
jgi:hypothetical protein